MKRTPSRLTLLLAALFIYAHISLADDTPAKSLADRARAAFAAGNSAEAVKLADEAIQAEPKEPRNYLLRGQLHAALKQPTPAIADFTKLIELQPSAVAYDLRGSERFKLNQIDESLTDFDRAIELQPNLAREHWKRGISLYYAARYVDGQRQFESYQTFDDNDVENAVWRFLCMARGAGLDEARKSILKIRRDRRVPMMEIYDLFAGKLTADDVLQAVTAGDPSETELYQRRFYAHLYLGLFYDATGKPDLAKQHIDLAAHKYPIGHYMADVARVHAQRLAAKP